MIARLSGQLIEKQPPIIVLDVNGVGYELQVPMTSIYPLPAIGQPVVLLTHLSISENAHQLFGFYTSQERDLFRLLIKVNGVGPKMALAVLSGMSAEEFTQSVQKGDTAALVKVPGVGKKTAERLIIEIKDRLPKASANHESNTVAVSSVAYSAVDDAESALIALGYKPADAARMVSKVNSASENISSEELIKRSLQRV